jgi:DNA-binding response OmpR family regulator
MAAETILVVEDTELLRRIYTDKLEQEGYHVVQASDGRECLATLRSQDVDLVLLDLVMPHLSGLDALKSIKRNPRTKDVPVVILSNLGQEADVERGMALGARDYLVKNSAKPADVSVMIRRTLDHLEPRQPGPAAFRLVIADHEADADAFVEHSDLARRFWCPACEIGLVLDLVEQADRPGWYDAHLICPDCGREF